MATAYKLEVGHPPGAPLFMILARVASAFVSRRTCPWRVNTSARLASAFTILFLFWSITHMAHKLATRDGKEELTTGSIIAVLGSGVVGALAYTWSDTFWFSAVEGEVYAHVQSFFTAIVFWAILKWESEADATAQHTLAHPHLPTSWVSASASTCWPCCVSRPSPSCTTSSATSHSLKGHDHRPSVVSSA
jgi:hypothetical protein